MKFESFWLNDKNFSESQEKLEQQLAKVNVKEKDILRAQLLVEEIFLRMTNQGKAAQVKVQVVKKIFGKVQVIIYAEGTSYNPFVEMTDWDEEDQDYYNMLILKANRQKLSWVHKNNLNIVTISVRGESNTQTWLTIAGIVGGIICGVAMKEFLSPETISLISDNIIVPIRTMFLNALSMVIAPVIFFSIMSGITEMGKGANVGNVGLKLFAFFFGTTIISMSVSLIVAWLLFHGGVSQVVGLMPSSSAEVTDYEFSLVNFIVNIIPINLVNPFADGKFLQIIFIAVLFGVCLNALGDKVRLFREFVSNLNDIFAKMMGLVILFVPPIAFFAMVSFVLDANVAVALLISKLIVGQLAICCVMFCVYTFLIRFVGKISPKPFMRKVFSLCPIAFATSSSNAAMPSMMKLCTQKLGIAPKFSSFCIPIAVPSNMNSSCLYLIPAVIMFLKMYDVELDINTFGMVALLTLSLSLGIPPVPAAYVICVVTIAAHFGVPKEIAGILFCIDALCDRICACISVIGDVAATIVLARTENLVDEKVYSS